MIKENFIRHYQESFKAHWERPALSDYFKEEYFTYGMMAEEIARLHLLFECCKIRKGDKIALIGRNNTRWCITYMATITYGAVIVPILQDFSPNDVHHIINDSDSVMVFAGDQHWDAIDPRSVEKIRASFSLTDFRCKYDRFGHEVKNFSAGLNKRFRERYPEGFRPQDVVYPEVPNDQLMQINYTSGTTGFSKGVMLTGNNLGGNIFYGIKTRMHYPGSRDLSFLPLAHAYGCAFDFLLVLATGAHVTLLGKIPSPKILVEAFARVRPSIIFMVPMIMEKIYKKQILPVLEKRSVRLALKIPLARERVYEKIRNSLTESFGGEFEQVVIGGAPLNSEVEEFLYRIGFRFTVGYGMTECAPLISYVHYKQFVPTSCGKPLEGYMEVRIDSEDPERVPGEIQVRGENVTVGYYKNKEATKEAFTPDGWLHTGDMGTLDKNGYLYIRGRYKSMLLGSNGQNIYPEELESKLNNLPCVTESVVIQRSGKLVALVYPDYEENHSMEKIKAVMENNKKILNSMVAPYERISEIILYPTEFEKTPKKSIKRYLYNI